MPRHRPLRALACAAGLSAASAISGSRPALADEPWGFVQITCVPELGYFSIRRFVVMNLPRKGPYLTEGLDPGPAAVATLERKSGIFDSAGLQAHAFECSIPAVTNSWGGPRPGFTARVVGHLDKNSQESSYCRIRDDAEVIFNGQSVGIIGMNPCRWYTLDSIGIAHDGQSLAITKCEESHDASADGKNHLVCSTEQVAAAKR
jgi:hypothetical protein